jgi:hypothetical protein
MDATATTLLSKHNDLLARIGKLAATPDLDPISKQLANTLMAVVVTHTFVQVNRGKSGFTKRCTECGFAYPCSTIQLIEKEL